MSEFVYVTGSLSYSNSDAVPPVCFVLPEPLDGGGAVKEIAKRSDENGSWSLMLGRNADYEIVITSAEGERPELGRSRISVGLESLEGVKIVLQE